MPRKKKPVSAVIPEKGATIRATAGSVILPPDSPGSALNELKESYTSGMPVEPVGDSPEGGETDQPTKRRGRRTNAEIEAEKQAALDAGKESYKEKAQAFAAMSGVMLDIICARLPNPLPPTPQEKEFFSVGVGAIAEKYLPQAGGYDAEITLGLAALMILAPRLVKVEKKIPDTVGTTAS